MTEVPYQKYHGTGNDFAVVEGHEDVPDRPAFAIALCADLDADGVLFLEPEETDGDGEEPPVVDMTLYQPDGSTAEMCGNGARVAGRWGSERTGADEVLLETDAGPRHTRIHEDWSVTVEMGTPSFDPAAVPVEADEPMVETELEGYVVTAVNTGVPHAVAFVDDVQAVDIDADAPPIRHADVFPEGANATFAARTTEGFDQRTFERGVEGETLSCGTGAVAIAAVATHLGEIEPGESTVVSPPGGDLTVTVREDWTTTLRGPTAFEFSETAPRDPDTPAVVDG
ncbi:Diaminopimelate epimerase/Proline racemase [Halanaeroarchaeum sp. HSR-CO]|uniref:diaminopimelate epimerase n=1 Tax=Halanaeroarchaeum sp. HSR-CO TaxID=2866382 RepID=UPI00217D5015|nr:diaminopimelate epimerase [Halanaeroarchaeum sp. HSR-CO]UWG47351.1 Diaminopimelate epimerase/Proline racemase [Halanaeroarchaeum sp. HSR-CO]